MDRLQMEKMYKALADHTRLKILQLLSQGQQCGCNLIENLPITQPTLSHHLKVLSKAGIIFGTKEQNKILYTVNKEVLNQMHQALLFSLSENPLC